MDHIPLYDWSLFLFFSADIQGSTEYKPKDSGWRDIFVSFYHEFPARVRQIYSDKHDLKYTNEKSPQDLEFEIWKYLGDEVLMYLKVTALDHVLLATESFHSALKEHSQTLKDKSKNSLSLKGTAWLAGFPVQNAIFFDDVTGMRDFIGPNIDLGFRLTKHSSSEKMVVSVDLAYLLLEAKAESKSTTPSFHCDEAHALKGVNKGKAYPIIWINCGTTIKKSAIEQICFQQKKDHEVLKVCDEYFKVTRSIRPFITENNIAKFGKIPKDFEEKRLGLVKMKKDDSELYGNSGPDENGPDMRTPPKLDAEIDKTLKRLLKAAKNLHRSENRNK